MGTSPKVREPVKVRSHLEKKTNLSSLYDGFLRRQGWRNDWRGGGGGGGLGLGGS